MGYVAKYFLMAFFAEYRVFVSVMHDGALFQSLAASMVKLSCPCLVLASSFHSLLLLGLRTYSELLP